MPFKKGEPRPANSGRKKGSINKRTLDDLYAMCEKSGVEPFQVFLDLTKSRDEGIKLNAAKEAAKYLYFQRRAIETSGPGGGPIEVESSAVKEILADFKLMLDTKENERKGG